MEKSAAALAVVRVVAFALLVVIPQGSAVAFASAVAVLLTPPKKLRPKRLTASS